MSSVRKNLGLMAQEIEALYEDNDRGLYIRIQAAYQQRYGGIPSAGAICAYLQAQGMAGHKGYSQRATEEKFISRSGYVIIRDAGQWIPEHILVARQQGWQLDRNTVVHHINGVRSDNRPKNLQLMSRADHSRLHALQRWADPTYREMMTRKIRSAAARRRLEKRIAEINSGKAA